MAQEEADAANGGGETNPDEGAGETDGGDAGTGGDTGNEGTEDGTGTDDNTNEDGSVVEGLTTDTEISETPVSDWMESTAATVTFTAVSIVVTPLVFGLIYGTYEFTVQLSWWIMIWTHPDFSQPKIG